MVGKPVTGGRLHGISAAAGRIAGLDNDVIGVVDMESIVSIAPVHTVDTRTAIQRVVAIETI
ncbi:hypothetical protein FQZ97_1225560 [compost metagenome]